MNFRTFPVHTVVQGTCSCGNAACGSPGKHPVAYLAPHGVKDARLGWTANGYNVGVATGDGLVVLDVDPRSGGTIPKGLPDTYTVRTGGGGWHLYFAGDSACGSAGAGLDIKGRGGYVVGAGSVHVSGSSYVVERDVAVAPLPAWLQVSRRRGSGVGDAADTELGRAFRARGMLGLLLGDGKRAVVCPWNAAHTSNGATSTVLFNNGVFYCSHSHCLGRTQKDVRAALGMLELATDEKGRLIKSAANDDIAAFREDLWFDAMAGTPMIGDDVLENHHASSECARWARELKYVRSKTDAYDAMERIARLRPVHKLRQYLDNVKWDGVCRVNSWLQDYCGAETPLAGPAGRCCLVSAVARAFDPGCKVDTMLVMMSHEQGKRKSLLLETLAGAWYRDTPFASAKQFYEQVRGGWIYELAEMAALRGMSWDERKALISSRSDVYRASYGRQAVAQLRTCIMVCTTNKDEFLSDSSGDRRFHVVRVGECAVDRLSQDRDQLWAEAVHMYRAGVQWWLTEQEENLREGSNEAFRVTDEFDEVVEPFLKTLNGAAITSSEVVRHVIDCKLASPGSNPSWRVRRSMRNCGYEPSNQRIAGSNVRYWQKKR